MQYRLALVFVAAAALLVSAQPESGNATATAGGANATESGGGNASASNTTSPNATAGNDTKKETSAGNVTSAGNATSTNATSSPNLSELCRDRAAGLYSWFELQANVSGGNTTSQGGNATSSGNATSEKTGDMSGANMEEMCSKYIFCANGVGHLLNCPNTLVFSPEKLICMAKGVVPKPCGTSTLLAAPAPSCAGKTDGESSRNFDDCRAYWTCQKGTAELRNCSHGMIYSELNKTCIPQGAANVPLCLPPADATVKPFCEQQNSTTGFYSDPSTCTRGVICLNQTQFFYTCTGWPNATNNNALGGFQFSNTTMSCVDKREEKCEPKPLPLAGAVTTTTATTTTSKPSGNTTSTPSGGSGNTTVHARRRRAITL